MENGKWKMENGKGRGEKILQSPISNPQSPISNLRLGLVVGFLLFALGVSFVTRRLMADPVPAQTVSTSTDAGETGEVYFVDTEGWYRITDNERAVVSPYTLRLSNLPDSLPMKIGPWHGEPLPLGPEIDEWFDNPEVALQREYRNTAGDVVWLSVFGSRGPKSFRLFEHTPATCYPLSGWTMMQEDLDTIKIGDGEIYAQRGFAANGSDELIVLYLYLWDNPDRDPTDGVLSIRASAPVLTNKTEALSRLKQDFLPYLFADVVSWRRF